jgi:pimeloyl-ACP methyl ester carboxylesterase
MDVQTVEVPTLPGTTRDYLELPARRGGRTFRMHVVAAGEGPALLLLHGAPQNHLVWADLLPRYAEHYRVICPDLRGAGWTEAPGSGYDPAALIEDLRGILRAYGLSRVRIIAHDWSAIIAFLLATDEPHLVEQLVILSVPDLFVVPDARVLRLMARGWFELVLPLPVIGPAAVRGGRQGMLRYMQSVTGSAFGDAGLPHAELDRRLLRDRRRARDLCRLYRGTIVPALIGLMAGRHRHRFLSTPTLQLMGADDPAALLLSMGRRPGRTAALERQQIPGAGHYLIDEAGDEVFRRTAGFFRGSIRPDPSSP